MGCGLPASPSTRQQQPGPSFLARARLEWKWCRQPPRSGVFVSQCPVVSCRTTADGMRLLAHKGKPLVSDESWARRLVLGVWLERGPVRPNPACRSAPTQWLPQENGRQSASTAPAAGLDAKHRESVGQGIGPGRGSACRRDALRVA